MMPVDPASWLSLLQMHLGWYPLMELARRIQAAIPGGDGGGTPDAIPGGIYTLSPG